MENPGSANKIRELLDSADGLLITAGAGMGVDSGLPDFRGNDGLWQHYPALGRLKKSFTSIANPQAFKDHPKLAWGFYGHRLQLYRQTQPHAGFTLLKQFGEQLGHGYFVFTSNVDGQFQKAGFDPDRIYECHGSIHFLQCSQSCCRRIWSADQLVPIVDNETSMLVSPMPICPHCQALARPNILMFGDYGWLEQRYEQQLIRLRRWLLHSSNPVVIEIGAGTAVPTVREFSDQFMARLIRVNPTEAFIPHDNGVSLAMPGLEGIKQILRA